MSMCVPGVPRIGHRSSSVSSTTSALSSRRPSNGSRDDEPDGSGKKKEKSRATLAETWALSGKEAMALALSQGRFDRQMERHTDELRQELQDSIHASEGRMLDAIASQNAMLHGLLASLIDGAHGRTADPGP